MSNGIQVPSEFFLTNSVFSHELDCCVFSSVTKVEFTSWRLCIKVGRGQGDGDKGTGTSGRACGTWDSGTWDARRGT